MLIFQEFAGKETFLNPDRFIIYERGFYLNCKIIIFKKIIFKPATNYNCLLIGWRPGFAVAL